MVVADDHPLFREGAVRALASSDSVEVVGEAGDGAAALELIRNHAPDVALIDYWMPSRNGVEVAAALQQGAAGFLPKESTRSEIVNAVLDCAKGRDVIPSALMRGLTGEIRRRAEPTAPALSGREREVLSRIANGQSVPKIATELHVASSTVKSHVQRLYEKLGVSNRGAAVAEAMRRQLLD